MGNLDRCWELLYTYLSQSSWGLWWWINLGTFVVSCVQKVGALWHQMHSEGRCIWCFIQQRVNPFLHMVPNDTHLLDAYDAKCTHLLDAYDAKLHQANPSLQRPISLWQIGVERIQAPHQIPHLMGKLERNLDFLYTYLSQSSWGHGWWINLGTFWRHMRSEGRSILV